LTQGLVFFSWLFFRLPDPASLPWPCKNFGECPPMLSLPKRCIYESLGLAYNELLLLLWGLFGVMAVSYGFKRWTQGRN
jgi:alginate O-acetyltransferase complex protein AlgI